ncbi:carbonic anhydrase [Scytonema hofmannii FACHB-248]|uniref:carbonic anhydrase n=1 Tax=Scytonema hofmannii FACHB-248 TaxID=1842502 RepID=A0ABR8GZN0_9CYAN|nr:MULTISPECIES: carbonic anhydrase [Nostocales]MBD2608604.1 carbonic anhydrase [Scytonema hofmannii FACHB-248]
MSRINGFVGRRHVLKLASMVGFGMATSFSLLWDTQQAVNGQTVVADAHPVNPNPVTPDVALRRLLDGNKRFVQQKRNYPDQNLERLRSLILKQHPFASVLGCADSRVPPEIIFDQGLGNLFVVRVAGNVVNDLVTGSLEYSTTVLGSQLILILGHRRCGAVAEAIKNKPFPGKIGFVVENIKPAVERVKLTTGDIEEDAILANIQYQVEELAKKSKILAKLVSVGKLKIVGACYDIETGKVTVVT